MSTPRKPPLHGTAWRPFDEGWYDALLAAAGLDNNGDTGDDAKVHGKPGRRLLRHRSAPDRDYHTGYAAARALIRYLIRNDATADALREWIEASIAALGTNRASAMVDLISEAEQATKTADGHDDGHNGGEPPW
ncbi:hypothetical protein ABN028_33985 [Actinopolymorpha sp. B17G11]|uniref:hypothetical protein n=1 Tax=Actinopolymorpha sp. B17G11 TaxID=3160861 RepID=UPI0032E3D389